MKRQKKITLAWTEYDLSDELDGKDRDLVMAAKEACGNAYAPYSNFHVGAALLLDDGTIITGTNVENAAFPSGICAERNVLSTFASVYPGRKPIALAVAASGKEGVTRDPVSPCGNCRQVIAEEEYRSKSHIRIILAGEKRINIFEKGEDLLPVQFNRDSLI